MKIKVTQDHIDAGDAARGSDGHVNCQYCPIAFALAEAGFDRPAVGSCIHFVEGVRYKQIVTPIKARLFINRFDSGLPVKPFSFDI